MEQDTVRTPSPPRRLKWVVGLTLVAAGVGGLAAWAASAPGAVSYYTTPSEVAVQAPSTTTTLRLGGRVSTITRDGPTVSFGVTDGNHEVPVRYTGEVPDTLQASTDVIAEGTLDADGTLVATRVLAKCSSKFVDASDADEHLGRDA